MESQRTESQGDEATVPASIVLSRRTAGMALLAVQLDDHPEFRVGEVDAGHELVAVEHLVLGDRLGQTGATQQLAEPGLEDAAHWSLTGGLAIEHRTNDPTTRAENPAEFFPPTPRGGRREPPPSKPVVEKLFEAVDADHHAKVEECSKGPRRRYPLDLGDVPGVETLRLVPQDVGSSITSAMPERSHLDDAFPTVDQTQQRCGRSV